MLVKETNAPLSVIGPQGSRFVRDCRLKLDPGYFRVPRDNVRTGLKTAKHLMTVSDVKSEK
jgi:hypothetical protein